MSDTVRVAIELPRDQYNLICKSNKNGVMDAVSKECMAHAIRCGELLPTSYGRCIDVDDLFQDSYTIKGYDDLRVVDWEDIERANTILEPTPDRYYGTQNKTRE